MKTKKPKKIEYCFAVMYHIKHYHPFSDKCLDVEIEKVSKGEIGGSGAGCGWRDVSLYFPTKRKADNAFKRLKEHFGKKLRFFNPPELIEYF